MPAKKLIYVIQEHHATHLHYDLRLEQDGVLWSWAVPKEPDNKGTKRLAVRVEDHDKGYAKFEGVIEEGYGKGSVKIWDKGFWIPESIKDNNIVAVIKGSKLKGRFALVRLKETKNWLFFKIKEDSP